MTRQEKAAHYRLSALVSIHERGQIVLPKEIRAKAEIKAGDQLAIVTFEEEGKIRCIMLIKAEEFKESICRGRFESSKPANHL